MNVRADEYFIEAPYEAQADRFGTWVRDALGARLLVIEVGADFNTPSVIRWRLERIVDAAQALCDLESRRCEMTINGRYLYDFTDHTSEYGSVRVARLLLDAIGK